MQKLQSKPNVNQLLNYSPSLQNPFNRNDVNEVILNIVHHTPQQLKEVFPRKTTKGESLNKVTTATVDCL